MIDSKRGESHPREVKMIRKNREIVGRLYECRGFTLIELVVVMGVIGILIAIAAPTYLDYKAKAHDLSSLTDAQNLLKLANQVLIDYDQIYLLHNTGDGSVIGNENDLLGNFIPQIYNLSLLGKAYVLILNYEWPPPTGRYTRIYVRAYNEKGTDDPFGLNGKKTFQVYMDFLTGQVTKNY